VATPVPYLLLLGPMGLLCDTGWIPDEIYYAVWRPYVNVEERLPEFVNESMTSYEQWWRSSFERVEMAWKSTTT
jgi:hypothetical protein